MRRDDRTGRAARRCFVVSFHTTADAMDAESVAAALRGRLMPVPRRLSAGCGIAYAVPESAGSDLLRLLGEAGIGIEDSGVLDVR